MQHHSHSHNQPSGEEKSREAIRVTWIGALIDGILGLSKIVVGWLFFSHALVADGIHSLSDLLTDFMVVAIVKVSHAEPDAEHPYGHERFETLGTVFLGFLLVAVAGALAYDSSLNLLQKEQVRIPGWPALLVALVSITAKEWIFRYTRSVGKRLRSDLLIANAWHSRTDAYSSIVVFVGIGGAMLGLPWLDSVAAFAVAIFIAKVGWDLSWNALRELVDTAIDPKELEALTRAVMEVEGIKDVHSFKSRQMGSKMLLELHLQVEPHLSASESHYIGDSVMMKLMKEFDDIGHIIFHIDTENDDDTHHNLLLPLRSEITELIDQAVEKAGDKLKRHQLTLHYLQDQIEAELFIDGGSELTAGERVVLNAALNRELSQHNWFRQVRLWYAE